MEKAIGAETGRQADQVPAALIRCVDKGLKGDPAARRTSYRQRTPYEVAGLMGMVVGGMVTGGPWGALVDGLIRRTCGGDCKKD